LLAGSHYSQQFRHKRTIIMSTIKDALEYAVGKLAHEEQKSAVLDAQVLLGYVLDVDRATLYTYPERALTSEQEQQFFQLIERREHGEPVAYLTGHKEFYGLDFFVDRRVLIPRPETELLVEIALNTIRKRINARRIPIVADIGTGSGAIPIALAVEEPLLPYLYASDVSTEALQVARLNCQRHHVEQRVHLLRGDLLAPFPEPVDVLIANLPYVGTDEMNILAPDILAYEPHLALFSGPNGLDLIGRLLIEAKQSAILADEAVLLLEIGYQQRQTLTRLVNELWPRANIAFKRDFAGWDRVLQVALPAA
jgi:release factor glutamine methyltransferase